MKFFFQFITTPTADTPGTTLLLHFDDKRYLFGHVSEGTQRACVERGVRLSYVTDIFLTGKTTWDNNGGLLGMVLTLAEAVTTAATANLEFQREKLARLQNRAEETADLAAIERIKEFSPRRGARAMRDGQEVEQRGTLTLHGGPNLTHSVATARRFIFRKGMPLYVHEFDQLDRPENQSDGVAKSPIEPTWTDNHIKVWALPITPSTATSGAVGGSPRSWRKRSLEEFQERPSTEGITGDEGTLDQHAKAQMLRQAVVSDMFNSNWRLDSVVETPISEVRMPANMFLRNPITHKLEEYTGPKPGGKESVPDIKVFVRKPWPGALIESLPPTSPSEVAMSYIVRNHDVRGKFDPKKAAALKVKKGPNFSLLAKGENVQSLDGHTITPDMVLGESRAGRGVAIIDLPTADYVEGLVNRPEWTAIEVTKGMEVFVWILGPGVGSDARLQKFISSMSQFKHVVSSPDYCTNYLAFQSGSAASIRLSKLDPERYQTPAHDNVTLPQTGISSYSSPARVDTDAKKSIFQAARPGLLVEMEPNFGLNTKEVIHPLNTALVVERFNEAIMDHASRIRSSLNTSSFEQKVAMFRKNLPCGDAEIIALGTGSSLPSKYRNVSATLLRVPGHGCYLLDCGENTLGQLKRVLDPDELKEVLSQLKMIWISHLHADHHLGTVSVIKAWYQEVYGTHPQPCVGSERGIPHILAEKRLFVVSHESMIDWLSEYASVENYGFDKLVPLSASSYEEPDGDIKSFFTYRHCGPDGRPQDRTSDNSNRTVLAFDYPDSPLTTLLQSATGLNSLLTTPVSHCHGANAVSLVFPSGFKFSYSGDCRPSLSFANIGRDSTVLLHEATFEDDMAADALAKRHSTVSEALGVATAMRARTLVLTHFSQRYQSLLKMDQPSNRPSPSPKSRSQNDAATDGSPSLAIVPDIPISGLDDPSVPFSNSAPTLPSEGDSCRMNPDFSGPVVAAFDFMRLRVADALSAEAHLPAIVKMFEMEQGGVVGGVKSNQGLRRLSILESDQSNSDEKTKKYRLADRRVAQVL